MTSPTCALSGVEQDEVLHRLERWGGSIHIAPDDFSGRCVGHQVGLDAVALASKHYDGK